MKIQLTVAYHVGRELVRAAGVPLHIAGYLLRRRHHEARARAALEVGHRDLGTEDSLARFLAQHLTARASGAPHVVLSAGEASGETHAGNLIDAVAKQASAKALTPPRWSCLAGPRTEARGAKLVYPLSENAVMGVWGVFASLPFIMRGFAAFLRLLRDDRPDLVVLIDYPGLHLVFARAARRAGIPVVHYVAPQYWAWGPWRMARYRRCVDATLTILPFEPAFFDAAGVFSEYVGHPLLDEVAATAGSKVPAPVDSSNPVLCILPGSRRKEIALHLAPMLNVARALRQSDPELRVVLPHLDERRRLTIERILDEAQARDEVELVFGDPAGWLKTCQAALVKSGTGSLEACLHGAPTVVVYVVEGRFGRWFLGRMLTVPYFAAANLCMNREIVPEIAVTEPGHWELVTRQTAELLRPGPRRDRCRSDLRDLRERLGKPGASARVARWILPFCRPLTR